MSKMFIETDHAPLVRRSLNGATMGTRFSAVFYAPAGLACQGVAAALQAAVDEVDDQMSTYREHSALMDVNRAQVGQWVVVPAALFCVLSRALEIGAASGGAFDIGVGDAVAAAGFGAFAKEPGPDLFTPRTGDRRPHAHEALALDVAGSRVLKLAPLSLDLSGIAKGYGVDRLAEVLQEHGIKSYLVSIDGEVRAGCAKPGAQPWVIAVEAPIVGVRAAGRLIEVEGLAAATSGDYRHWRQAGQTQYAHTIDPRTGTPVQNELASVTVLAEGCMDADALASAFLVLGAKQGAALARKMGVPALFMQRTADGGVRELASGDGWSTQMGAA